jgi:hypothetical protein
MRPRLWERIKQWVCRRFGHRQGETWEYNGTHAVCKRCRFIYDIPNLLLFGLLAANANPAAFYEGLAMARLRGNAVTDAWADAGLNTGLVEYWAMRTNGTTVLAEYGTNTGTAVNGVLFGGDYGKRDGGAYFDGVDDYIRITGTATPTNIWTMSLWINPQAATNPKVIDFETGRVVFEFVPGAGEGFDGWRIFDGLSVGSLVTNSRTNQWSHWTITQSGTTIAFYLNGGVTRTTTSSGKPIGGTGIIGSRFSADQTFYKGSIDEVAIWSRALSSNEVYQLYNTPLYAPYKE